MNHLMLSFDKFRIIIMLILGTFFSFKAYPIEIAFEEDSRLPLININIAIKAGSVSDPPGQEGLTNFMGEMLLRGTQSRTKQQLDLALDQMGATFEVETRAEALIFRGAVLSSQLGPYLKLLTEILTQPKFPEFEIKKLKSEIISGLVEELGHDGSLSSRRFTRFLFRGHPYGKSVLGRMKDIENITQGQILDHYHQLFQDRALLVVGSGATTQADITTWANNLASLCPDSRLKTANLPPLKMDDTPKDASERRLLIIDKPERTQTQIHFGQIGILMTDKDFFPLYLGNYAFGGSSFSAILMTEIRVKRGWSYGANSFFRFGTKPRSWQVHLFPASKDTPNALTHSLKLLEDLKNNGIPLSQFELAKRSLINKSGFIYNTPRKRVENTLLEKTLNLPTDFMKSYGNELQKVSLADVNMALKSFIKPENLAISVLGTASELKQSLTQAAGVSESQVEVVSYSED